jgi:hypothetical protein
MAVVTSFFPLIAKEIVIGGLTVIYGGADLAGHISALQAISFTPRQNKWKQMGSNQVNLLVLYNKLFTEYLS